MSPGDKVFYRNNGTNWRAHVTSVTSMEIVDVSVHDDTGLIMYGVVDAVLAVTAEDKETDGHWWPRP